MSIQNLNALYTLNYENEVVVFHESLNDFVRLIKEYEPENENIMSFKYYRERFAEDSIVSLKGTFGQEYKLQMLFNRE